MDIKQIEEKLKEIRNIVDNKCINCEWTNKIIQSLMNGCLAELEKKEDLDKKQINKKRAPDYRQGHYICAG